jgi:hypothetical protein
METGGGTYSSVGNHPQTLFVNTVMSRLVNRISILEVLRGGLRESRMKCLMSNPPIEKQIEPLHIRLLRRTLPSLIRSTGDKSVRFRAAQGPGPKAMTPDKIQHSPGVLESEKQPEEGENRREIFHVEGRDSRSRQGGSKVGFSTGCVFVPSHFTMIIPENMIW